MVALLQSLQSSRHSMMNSLCCILARTSNSTARACPFKRKTQITVIFHEQKLPRQGSLKTKSYRVSFTSQLSPFPYITCNARFFRPGAGAMSPGVSIIVRFGQYLYSTLMMISLEENRQGSRSNLMFSASM